MSAYVTLLKRGPDPSGYRHYVAELARGVDKADLIEEISNSAEGRRAPREVTGLTRFLAQRRLWRLPIVGPFVRLLSVHRRLGQAIEATRRLDGRVEGLGRQLSSQAERIDEAIRAIETFGSRTLENVAALEHQQLARQAERMEQAIKAIESLKTDTADSACAAAEVQNLLRQAERMEEAVRVIETLKSGAAAATQVVADDKHDFDPDWYYSTYPDVPGCGLSPLEHYSRIGRPEGRFASHAEVMRELFDAAAYLAANPDVAAAGVDPLRHFLTQGRYEGRRGGSLPLVLFDADRYRLLNPDVVGPQDDPLQHFILYGFAQRRPYSSFVPPQAVQAEPLVFSEPPSEPAVRIIAFYLPQFHPIPENDAWWGRGFTEWTNVVRGRPFYKNHDQPRLPGELGFYDLRIPEVMKRQAELARIHGIHGFCIYTYWFGGKRLLEGPVEMLLQHPEIDIGFCYCWANENWTRRWDGLENDVLMAQAHSPDDDIAFIRDAARGFRDPRYIRVDGKPLLAVYRPGLFPDMRATSERWRQWCREEGIGEIHLCMVAAFDRCDPADFGMDASIEFPPLSSSNENLTTLLQQTEESFSGQAYNYMTTVKGALRHVRPPWTEYRGVMPSWDNTARKMERGYSFFGATPELYAEWLEHAVNDTIRALPEPERLVFVNAWNEWGEGAYLEPDRRRGYAYLNKTRDVVARHSVPMTRDAELSRFARRRHDLAIILHLHYGDLLDDIAPYVDNVEDGADLFVTVREGCYPEMAQRIHALWPDAVVASYPNHGRDVLPFLRVMSVVGGLGYSAICKVHGKRSKHRNDGDLWRDDVFSKLLGSPEKVRHCLALLGGDVGLVAPGGHLLHGSTYWGSNAERVSELAWRMRCSAKWVEDFYFPAGTMFWFKPEALKPLLALDLGAADFEAEAGQVDGTTAHAVERLVGLSVLRSGLRPAQTDEPSEAGYRFAAPTTTAS